MSCSKEIWERVLVEFIELFRSSGRVSAIKRDPSGAATIADNGNTGATREATANVSNEWCHEDD